MSITTLSPPTDFDFMIGSWRVSHRRLNRRFAECTDWTEFAGTSTTRKVLQGFGNLEDNVLQFPDGAVHAVAIRSFDVATQTWAIWWLDGRNPHHLDVPVIGRFVGETGEFYADDLLEGQPIRVRFLWHRNPGSHPRWEQAFSRDGGLTWEVNWVMDFHRIGP
ncbi:MAG: hypothetical protein MUE46_17935 [Xanthomonadales bacterium]|nr:hypothetical protein [Xanthomonadales bacterium]